MGDANEKDPLSYSPDNYNTNQHDLDDTQYKNFQNTITIPREPTDPVPSDPFLTHFCPTPNFSSRDTHIPFINTSTEKNGSSSNQCT